MLALSDFMRYDMSVFGLIESSTLFTLRVIDTFFFFPYAFIITNDYNLKRRAIEPRLGTLKHLTIKIVS